MDITIRNLQTKIPIHPTRIKKAVRHALQYLRISDAELSIVFVSPQRMKTLNAKHLKHRYVTDILTFDYRASKLKSQALQAEVIICPSVAASNAVVYGSTLQKEIDLYVVHGLLHLAGYDDHSAHDIKLIRNKENEILKNLRHPRGGGGFS
jgi:probable rRNA maturation factor